MKVEEARKLDQTGSFRNKANCNSTEEETVGQAIKCLLIYTETGKKESATQRKKEPNLIVAGQTKKKTRVCQSVGLMENTSYLCRL